MSNSTIRLAKPGEESAIHNAHMRSIREICVKDHGEEEIRGWGFRELGNRWVDAIQRNEVWVIEDEGLVKGIGYIRIFEENGTAKAYLHALYLTPEVTGKRLATRLMGLMLEKAKASGVQEITLDSSITAHDFYKRFGFVDSGSMRQVDIGGYPVTSYPMRLQF